MPDFVLALGLVICLITDLKERRIYNVVLLPLLIFGLSYNLFTGGFTGLMQSILGTITGLGILIIPFALGGIGAGDVKLLAVIGAVKGPLFVVYSALGMGLAGGIIALLILTYQGSVINTLKSFFRGIWLMLITGFKVIKFDFDNEKTMLPYGLAIAIGVVGAYWWMR
ncbi:MAG: prepilin peptidase [Firmicutes bacterium]|nr:prepilin peptidase [Bacillota bacterium]